MADQKRVLMNSDEYKRFRQYVPLHKVLPSLWPLPFLFLFIPFSFFLCDFSKFKLERDSYFFRIEYCLFFPGPFRLLSRSFPFFSFLSPLSIVSVSLFYPLFFLSSSFLYLIFPILQENPSFSRVLSFLLSSFPIHVLSLRFPVSLNAHPQIFLILG